jgi:small GTP-binding protein
MADDFTHDVFLSHAPKDGTIVRRIAERLKADGVRVWFRDFEVRRGDDLTKRTEKGLEHSRTLVLFMSANAAGSDWAQLEAGTFRFRDPLNTHRQFVMVRLDEAPVKGSLAQASYIRWRRAGIHGDEYSMLLRACQRTRFERQVDFDPLVEKVVSLDGTPSIFSMSFSPDGRYALTGSADNTLRFWEMASGRALSVLRGHASAVYDVAFSPDGRHGLSGSADGTVRLWNLEGGLTVHALTGHDADVLSVTFSPDGHRLLSGSGDATVRLWEAESGKQLCLLQGTTMVFSVAFSPDARCALAGYGDGTVRLWDLGSGRAMQTLEGHDARVLSVAFSPDGQHVLSGSADSTVRLWDLDSGRALRVLEGHTASVRSVALSPNGRHAFSGSDDSTARLWEVQSGRSLNVLAGHNAGVRRVAFSRDGLRVQSGARNGVVRIWNQTAILENRGEAQVQYTNAKVLLVGDTGAGKTGLATRLALHRWEKSESTVGTWATQLRLPGDREVWLWDFAGQADQRIVHQLYMDNAALILLLFNADQEDVLPGLRDWQAALQRSVRADTPRLLVAGRIDTGFKASRGRLQALAQAQGMAYYETSAKTGEGCDSLCEAMIASIPWELMEKRTSPRIFKLAKDEILKLRDEGQVLQTFKELRETLWRRLPDEPSFTDEILRTVISLLDGPGVVKELAYGTYVLISPEWVNTYAQAVIRTLRAAENDLGALPLRTIAEGKLIYQSVGRDGAPVEMKRLPPSEERVVLGEMEHQLEQRGLCVRQGDKLVFPSHCGRDREAVLKHPSVFVSYAVTGFLDDIYATLVVKLADSESFKLKELWRDAADFVTLADDHHTGIKLTRESASNGNISVYFGAGVKEAEQVIFANYIHAHLLSRCESAVRLRHYVCPHCNTPKGNPEVLMQKLLKKKKDADVECDKCEQRFALWDDLERLFASEAVRREVEDLWAEDAVRLDSRRKGKLLALEVGSRVTSADQKCFEVPGADDEGIDMELEFTDDEGRGTGERLYLQLKSGNSHLRKRRDGAEFFTIKKQRWVKYWLSQPHPVMLVVGTFAEEVGQRASGEKLDFADVRWMEISSVLRRLSQNGSKPVKKIEFKAERLDLGSVRRWRERIISGRA